MTKPTKWPVRQRRLRSAWASVQSDQSLRCPPEESLSPKLPIKRTAKTLIRLGGCHFVGFVMRWLKFKRWGFSQNVWFNGVWDLWHRSIYARLAFFKRIHLNSLQPSIQQNRQESPLERYYKFCLRYKLFTFHIIGAKFTYSFFDWCLGLAESPRFYGKWMCTHPQMSQ